MQKKIKNINLLSVRRQNAEINICSKYAEYPRIDLDDDFIYKDFRSHWINVRILNFKMTNSMQHNS